MKRCFQKKDDLNSFQLLHLELHVATGKILNRYSCFFPKHKEKYVDARI